MKLSKPMKVFLFVILIAFLGYLCFYLLFGLMTLNLDSESKDINFANVSCKYLDEDPLKNLKVSHNIFNKNVTYVKGVWYGYYEYKITYSVGNSNHNITLKYFKTNQREQRNIRVKVIKVNEDKVRIIVYDSEIERSDMQYDINTDQEIILGP